MLYRNQHTLRRRGDPHFPIPDVNLLVDANAAHKRHFGSNLPQLSLGAYDIEAGQKEKFGMDYPNRARASGCGKRRQSGGETSGLREGSGGDGSGGDGSGGDGRLGGGSVGESLEGGGHISSHVLAWGGGAKAPEKIFGCLRHL